MSAYYSTGKSIGKLLFAALLLVASGCAKEEVIAPAHAARAMHKSMSATGTSGVGTHADSTAAPTGVGITDAGADQGDREHSSVTKGKH